MLRWLCGDADHTTADNTAYHRIRPADSLSSQIKAIPGIVAAYSSWRSEDGHGVTMAIYESQAAAEAAAPQIQSILAEVGPLMTAPPTPETYENVRDFLA